MQFCSLCCTLLHKCPTYKEEAEGTMPLIVQNYNKHFAAEENLQVNYSQVSKKFPVIYKLFANKWHPKEVRETYLSLFSLKAWSTLAAEEKAKHVLRNCSACSDSYPNRVSKTMQKGYKSYKYTLPNQRKQLNCLQKTYEPLQIWEGRYCKTSIKFRKFSYRRSLQSKRVKKEVKSLIEKVKKDCTSDIVLGNRISWSVYEKNRRP